MLNKVDLAVKNFEDLSSITVDLKIPNDKIVSVSALKGWGLDQLLSKIAAFLSQTPVLFEQNAEKVHR